MQQNQKPQENASNYRPTSAPKHSFDPPGPAEEPRGTPKDGQAETTTQNAAPKELKGVAQAPQREPMRDPGGPRRRSLPQKDPKKEANSCQNPFFLKKRETALFDDSYTLL